MDQLPKILCVDDEPNVLSALKRHLRKSFEVHTALSGAEGIVEIEQHGPFAVVISDMRMPKMNGAEFLSQVKQLSPFTTRILLTGYADMEAAQKAVNESQVFRFLTKPCNSELLTDIVWAATEHSRTQILEKELLEDTLQQSVKTLVEVIELIMPNAFSKATQIKKYADLIATQIQFPDRWKLDLAVMLCRLGYVVLPEDIIDKVLKGELLSKTEASLYENHPNTAYQLLQNIPRLDEVAMIVRDQTKAWKNDDVLQDIEENYCQIGAQILRISIDLDSVLNRVNELPQAVAELRKSESVYSNKMLSICSELEPVKVSGEVISIEANSLKVGMIIESDVRDVNGAMLVSRGHEVSEVLMIRLQQYAKEERITDRIRVQLTGSDG